MSGYQRQSSFTDGDVILSEHTNLEFNQLVTAFSSTTGHKHDGTSNEGPVIPVIGDTGLVTAKNKIEVDTSNNRFGVWTNVSGTSTEQVRFQDGAILPVTDNDIDLGSTSFSFKDAYFSGNMGIGTTSPARVLEVGTSATTNYFRLSNTSDARYGELYTDTNGVMIINADADGGGGAPNMRFQVSGSEKVRVTDDGKFGVGTSSPAYTLQVEDSSTTTAHLKSSAAYSRIAFENSTSGAADRVSIGSTSDHMVLFAGGGERVRILNTGNAGFGTSTPDSPLHIVKSDTARIRIEGTNSSGTRIVDIVGESNGSEKWRLGKLSSSSDDFAINIGGSEMVRIDTSGNVGIDETSPNEKLDVSGNARVGKTSTTGRVEFSRPADGNSGGYVGYHTTSNSDFGLHNSSGGGNIRISANSGIVSFESSLGTERMRIDSSGNLLVGKTTTSDSVVGHLLSNSGAAVHTRSGQTPLRANRLSNDGTVLDFQQDSTTHGSISISGSTTSYNTSSDIRLKENIEVAGPSGSIIDAIMVRSFDWKKTGENQRYGFVAQEIEEHFPEAVHTDDTEDAMKSVDYSKLVPMLLKEIQDLRKRVTALEEK